MNGVNLLASVSSPKNQATPTSPNASPTGSAPASAGDLTKSATVESSSEINFDRDSGITENLEGHNISSPLLIGKVLQWKEY